jgi:hypothetical protein
MRNTTSKKKSLNDDFLEIINDEPTFTIRGIDKKIHSLWENSIRNPRIHVKHQTDIIDLVKGIEIDVFNDDRVRYPGGRELSGKTGTMSNILTSYYFTLYNAMLLIPDMEINYKYDLKNLLYLSFNFYFEDTKLYMPDTEVESFISIFNHLNELNIAEKPFLKEEFWNSYINELKKVPEILTPEVLKEKQGALTPNKKGISLAYCLTKKDGGKFVFEVLNATELCKAKKENRGEHGSYGSYNYTPCYIYDSSYGDIDWHITINDEIKQTEALRDLFINLGNNKLIEHIDANECIRQRGMKGGSRKRKSRRKTKSRILAIKY